MKLIDPTYLSLPQENDEIRRFLTVHDRQVQFAMQKMRNNYTWRQHDPEGFKEKYDQLKVQLNHCLVEHLPDGTPITLSGLWQELQQRFRWQLQELDHVEPTPGLSRGPTYRIPIDITNQKPSRPS